MHAGGHKEVVESMHPASNDLCTVVVLWREASLLGPVRTQNTLSLLRASAIWPEMLYVPLFLMVHPER